MKKFHQIKKKRLVKYEQTQPYCFHHGWQWKVGKKEKKSRNFGHLKGVDTVKKIVASSVKLKIPILTFYVFSSENWKRPKKEISFLFKLIQNYFLKEIGSIIDQKLK